MRHNLHFLPKVQRSVKYVSAVVSLDSKIHFNFNFNNSALILTSN